MAAVSLNLITGITLPLVAFDELDQVLHTVVGEVNDLEVGLGADQVLG